MLDTRDIIVMQETVDTTKFLGVYSDTTKFLGVYSDTTKFLGVYSDTTKFLGVYSDMFRPLLIGHHQAKHKKYRTYDTKDLKVVRATWGGLKISVQDILFPKLVICHKHPCEIASHFIKQFVLYSCLKQECCLYPLKWIKLSIVWL